MCYRLSYFAVILHCLMKILFVFLILPIACFSQHKNGAQLFIGLSAAQPYKVLATTINDSTSSYLYQSDDIREYFGFSYHRKPSKKIGFFIQFIFKQSNVSPYLISTRNISLVKGVKYYLTATQPTSGRTFLNINNLNGLSYDLNKHLTFAVGIGFDWRIEQSSYIHTGGWGSLNIDDIMEALEKAEVRKLSVNYGYSINFHIKKIYLTARFQQNLSDDYKGFDYLGTRYPLFGRSSSINLDLGYRFSW